jgi:hypothetical protein
MSKNKRTVESRRNFLKISAVGAAGLAIAGTGKKAGAQSGSPWPATGYMQINPNIDNCRVAYITDTSMLKRTTYNNFSDANNNAIDQAKVKANVDRMACALARKSTAAEAWKVIFRKPDAKSWAQVKVAMKLNCCGTFNPCVGTVAKLCEALNGLGVPYGNITLFDGGSASGNGCPDKYTPFKNSGVLPPVNIIARGGTYAITVAGWNTNSVTVVRDADIFLTVAVDKGHDRLNQFSGVTMSLKNHVGTINFSHPGNDPGVYMLCNYHKHEAVLGMPSAAVPAKQQLAFVDSLFAGKPGDWTGNVNSGAVLHTLVMGTLPGPVDYYTAKKIRTKLYNDFNVTRVNEFVEGFGYSAAERAALDTMNPNTDPAGRGFVDASGVTPPPPAGTTRDTIDAKIAARKTGAATDADVRTAIQNYRTGV